MDDFCMGSWKNCFVISVFMMKGKRARNDKTVVLEVDRDKIR